jgi:hypothetical protein
MIHSVFEAYVPFRQICSSTSSQPSKGPVSSFILIVKFKARSRELAFRHDKWQILSIPTIAATAFRAFVWQEHPGSNCCHEGHP